MGLQQELGYAGAVAVLVGNIGVGAVVVELAPRIRRLQCRELYVLIFDTHFEGVFAVNFGEVICNLERLADFVRRQEVITAQSRQAAKGEAGKAAVFGNLRYALDSVLSRNAERAAFRAESRGVKVVESSAGYIDSGGSKRTGIS